MASTNRLIHETSPYLLQHAHNPVDWYPWGEEALQKARLENKPILVSIGYSACHWCHVMEKESFENGEVAGIMNQHFINIKIDREERPDLDHIYMDAVQTMTGSGGWPLNVFLTPDAKPFYGGTYFPPQKAFNRSSWTETLQAIITAYTDRKTEIMSQAENLTAHLLQANNFGLNTTGIDNPFNTENTAAIFQNLMKNADQDDGGFGKAPKFPQTFSIQYLLRYYHFYKNEAALQHACLSLDKMIEGGIYDQLGGGFARYSTDNEWLAPHFEKMLYDNALLLAILSEAYQLTHNERYRNIISQTIGFIEREMLSADNGFYSALDADSEGEEGKFYVWNKKEIETVLGNDAALFCKYYGVSEKGNWDGKNILHVPVKTEIFLANQGIEGNGDFEIKLEAGRQQLLLHRSKRERPLLDDKILLGWNALMNTAYSKAFAATGEERYRQMAVQNMQFLLKQFADTDSFFHTYKDGVAKHPAFLDDYAFLIQALIHLQEITANADWLQLAQKITNRVIAGFEEQDGAFFYFTDKRQLDVIIRKKEVYDAATPSGNSVMAGNLFYLSHVFDNNDWKIRANKMMISLSSLIVRYPGSFGAAANNFLIIERGIKELVVTGKNFNDIHFDILHNFMPNRILQLSSVPNELFPLLKGKQYSNPVLIYLCENYVCNPPVNTLAELVQQLEN